MKLIQDLLADTWQEWVDRPDPENSFAAFYLGDDYAVLAVAEKLFAEEVEEGEEEDDDDAERPRVAKQLDFGQVFSGFDAEPSRGEEPMGDFRTYRTVKELIPVDRDVTPGVELIKQVFLTCWNRMQVDGRIKVKRFYICLPAWACKGQLVHEKMTIGTEGQNVFDVRPRIHAEHVRLLQDRAVLKAEVDGFEAVDLRAHYYTLDSERKVMPAENEVSSTLELHGYLTLAQSAILRELLGLLRKKNIKVDRVITPADACGGMLYKDLLQFGTVVVEMGKRHTGCSYYDTGHVVQQAVVETGSDQLVHDLSCAQRKPIDSVRQLVAQGGEQGAALVSEDLVCPIENLARDIFSGLELKPERDFARMNQVLVVGEDAGLCEAFQRCVHETYQVPCGYASMRSHELTETYSAGDAWRLLGMFELADHEGRESRRLYALERYLKPVDSRCLNFIERIVRRRLRRWGNKINRVVRQVYAGMEQCRLEMMRRL